MKEEFVRLLRESLAEIIGTLIAAGILAALGAVFFGYGIMGSAIVILVFAALALGVLWLSARIRPAEEPPIAPEFPPPPPPRPVPRPPHRIVVRFINRHDEQGRDIAELMIELLEEGQCINLWGSGGVGKTTLAVEATHRVFPAPFSGGVIWDSADGRADYGLLTLLDQVLTALSREDARTLAPDAKTDLVGYLLSESMPCLLGLDNFETIAREEQKKVLDFLAGVPCPVLLTSRMRLPQAHNIRVGPMTPEEANEFLQSLVEQSTERAKLEKVDFEEIAKIAERNPMLMRWVVAQLEQAMRPEDVFEDIARGRGEATERIFGRTFGLLGDDGQMALLALALFVPTASREALAAVCGFKNGKERVNKAIRRLAAFDLLDTAVEGDRLGIVALTRRLTRARLAKDERTDALVGRFVFHFLEYAEAHPEVTKEDLDALDDERENLLAALDYAYAAEDWQSVISLAGEICTPAIGLLAVRGYWDEALKWGERAAEAASHANLPAFAAAISGDMGAIHYQRGDYTQAREPLQKALLFFQQAGDEQSVAAILHGLGAVATAQGDYEEAKRLCRQSLEIKRRLGNEVMGTQNSDATTLELLGLVAQGQGDYQQARDLYRQSLEIARNLGHQALIAGCLHNLGIIAQHQGHYQQAKSLYDQSLEIKRQLGDQAGIASSLFQLGRLAEDEGKPDEAISRFKESLAIAQKLDVSQAEMVRRALARVSREKE